MNTGIKVSQLKSFGLTSAGPLQLGSPYPAASQRRSSTTSDQSLAWAGLENKGRWGTKTTIKTCMTHGADKVCHSAVWGMFPTLKHAKFEKPSYPAKQLNQWLLPSLSQPLPITTVIVMLGSLTLLSSSNVAKASENDPWEDCMWDYEIHTWVMWNHLPSVFRTATRAATGRRAKAPWKQTDEQHVLKMSMSVKCEVITCINIIYRCSYSGNSHGWLQESRWLGLLPCFTLVNCALDGNLKKKGFCYDKEK